MASFGRTIKVTIFGQSHAPEIGVTVSGLPAGAHVDLKALQSFCDLRAPGKNAWSTPRREPDLIRVRSGLREDGTLDGTPFRAVIENTNVRSGDYETAIPRPGHADFPSFVKHGHIPAGGGAYSGRMTAPLCIAGGVALQILAARGVHADAHLLSVYSVRDDAFSETDETPSETYKKGFPVLCDAAGERMKQAILSARDAGDSVGGEIEVKFTGLPVGLGDALFDGLDGHIAQAVFAVPAVKGIAFGRGFAAAALLGSQNNDPFRMQNGRVVTTQNASGGVLGGMSSGMPLLFTAAIKPTPSIFREQESVDLVSMENARLCVKGRHDPCVAPRAVVPVMSAAALAILDLWEEV